MKTNAMFITVENKGQRANMVAKPSLESGRQDKRRDSDIYINLIIYTQFILIS